MKTIVIFVVVLLSYSTALAYDNSLSSGGTNPLAFPVSDGNRYALIVNGGKNPDSNHVEFYENLAYFYRILINTYRWDKSDIVVCCSDGDDPAPDQANGTNSNNDLDGDNIPDYSNDARKSTVSAELDNLVNKTEPGDIVFIFLIDHGGYDLNDTPDVYMALWFPGGGDDPYLHDYELADYIAAMPPGSKKLVFVSACYSGGFVDDIKEHPGIENTLIVTSASYDQICLTSFAHWFITGLNMGYEPEGEESSGPGVNVDINRDSYASYREAYEFASRYGDNSAPVWYDSDALGEALTMSGVLPVVFQVDKIEHREYEGLFKPSDRDGLYEAGETVEIYVSIRNSGVFNANEVSLELAIENPDQYIEVINGSSAIPEIPTGETRANSEPLLVKVSDNLPENSSSKLLLKVNDGSYDYRIQYDIWLLLCEDSEVTYFYDEINSESESTWFEDGTDDWFIETDQGGCWWRCGNDNPFGYEGPIVTTLYSPVVYLSENVNNFLSISSMRQIRYGDTCSIDVYDGQDWRNLLTYEEKDNIDYWVRIAQQLEGYSGIMSQVRFTLNGNYNALGHKGWYLNYVGLGCWETPGIVTIFEALYDEDNEEAVLTWESSGEYISGYNIYRREIAGNNRSIYTVNEADHDLDRKNNYYLSATAGDGFLMQNKFNTLDERTNEGNSWIKLNDAIVSSGRRDYFDDGVLAGKGYEYKLELVYNQLPPDSYYTSLIIDAVPISYRLGQSYPNPATSVTNIDFTIPRSDTVTLSIYDIKGRLVAKPVDEILTIGTYSIPIDTSSLSSGVYFYRMVTPNFQKTMKMVVAR